MTIVAVGWGFQMFRDIKVKPAAWTGSAAVFGLASLAVGSNRAMAEEVALRCSVAGSVFEWEVDETRVAENGKKDANSKNIAIIKRHISWENDYSVLGMRIDVKIDRRAGNAVWSMFKVLEMKTFKDNTGTCVNMD